jgi:hypothetical protein
MNTKGEKIGGESEPETIVIVNNIPKQHNVPKFLQPSRGRDKFGRLKNRHRRGEI